MRLKTVVAPDPKTALEQIRRSLGTEAVIVATQSLRDGCTRVTAAIEDEDPDLDQVFEPSSPPDEAPWFQALAEHHAIPGASRGRLGDAVGALEDADLVGALGQALQTTLRFRPLDEANLAGVLLSGPPGAGKTLTTAKLAARATLAGRQVQVVSTDVERAGGLEPLRALLAPLEITPLAGPEARTLRRPRPDSSELLLIDSPAVNPFRAGDIGQLSRLIERSALPPVLVLPAGYDPGDSAEIAETYAALGSERVIVTKLDLARRFGGLLGAAERGLALADAGIAPTVGNGLRPFTARGLARLLLHGQLKRTAPMDRGCP